MPPTVSGGTYAGSYCLDDITLRCTPAKPGEGQDFRINTMTAAKTLQDCALLWRENNPGIWCSS